MFLHCALRARVSSECLGCLSIHIYIYIYVYQLTYTCVYIYIYTYIYIYISIRRSALQTCVVNLLSKRCIVRCAFRGRYWEERFQTPPPPGSNFGDYKCARIETKASIHHPLWAVVVYKNRSSELRGWIDTYVYMCDRYV